MADGRESSAPASPIDIVRAGEAGDIMQAVERATPAAPACRVAAAAIAAPPRITSARPTILTAHMWPGQAKSDHGKRQQSHRQ